MYSNKNPEKCYSLGTNQCACGTVTPCGLWLVHRPAPLWLHTQRGRTIPLIDADMRFGMTPERLTALSATIDLSNLVGFSIYYPPHGFLVV